MGKESSDSQTSGNGLLIPKAKNKKLPHPVWDRQLFLYQNQSKIKIIVNVMIFVKQTILDAVAIFAARECTFVHDRNSIAARREIDRKAPPTVGLLQNNRNKINQIISVSIDTSLSIESSSSDSSAPWLSLPSKPVIKIGHPIL